MEMNWLLLRDLTTTRCFLIGANLQFFSIEKVINLITREPCKKLQLDSQHIYIRIGYKIPVYMIDILYMIFLLANEIVYNKYILY